MNDTVKTITARDLLAAWRRADHRARALHGRLKNLAQRANLYRVRLVELTEVTRQRRRQTDLLQERLLQALESRRPDEPAWSPLPSELEALEGEQVPVEWVRHLLTRVQQAQGLLQQYETLLAFRENQVHELLERLPADGVLANDPQVARLAGDLAQSRNRIRLLTLELLRSTNGGEDQARLTGELEQARESLTAAEGRVQKLEQALRARTGELQKAATWMIAARQRLGALEEELTRERETRQQLSLALEDLSVRHEVLLKQHLQLQETQAEGTSSAVHDLKAKLEQVSLRYSEVKTALDESRRRPVEAGATRLEELESKLRESRRIAVRAQTEAAAQRRESTRLEGERDHLKSSLEQSEARASKLEELARAQARKLKEISGKT